MPGFFIGAVSGAIAAGGVYYAYSSTMNQRTLRHVTELRALSRRLEEPKSSRHVPPPASAHISREVTLSEEIKSKWNEGLQSLATIDRKLAELSRRISGRQ
ncbi:hypothetical protein BKA62DRAFT_685172 [Auriculariales sp. MPI-PUGE-AT-0066]|nr:hypothetical protein BKA62DRAFT_685172 [Auriculariales sp. MPI-PUGE-AT-0066]